MKIAIIGGSGKMGQWFARFLRKEGHEVIITGRDQEKLRKTARRLRVRASSNAEATGESAVVLVSVPIDSFEPVVREIAPHTYAGQYIIDFTSVKTMPVDVMHRYIKTGVTLGAHPVFGPGARNIKRNFVLTPTNNEENNLADKLRKFLEDRGARVSLMSPQEHDEMMAVVLGLAHFIALVSADALVHFPGLPRMKNAGGTTFKVLLTLIESVVAEDPHLYASLQMSLPGMAAIENMFQERAGLWAELVKSRDSEQFARRMSALREKLQRDNPDFGQAYRNMYKLADTL